MPSEYTSFEYLSLIEPLFAKIEIAIKEFQDKLSSEKAKSFKDQNYINGVKTKLTKIDNAYKKAKNVVSESTWSLINSLKKLNPLLTPFTTIISFFSSFNTDKYIHELSTAEGTYKSLKSIEIQLNNLAVNYENVTGDRLQSAKIINVKSLTGETYLDKILSIAKWGVLGVGVYYSGKFLLNYFEKPYPSYAKRIK